MKNKLFVIATVISFFTITEVFAAKGLSITLSVTDNDQNFINKSIRKASGMSEKDKGRHHVTVGFIEKNLHDNEMGKLGESIVKSLQKCLGITEKNCIQFDVKQAVLPFKNHVIALEPSSQSKNSFKKVNKEVNRIALELGHSCNALTKTDKYTPHMTLSSDENDLQYLPKLNNVIENLKSSNKNKGVFFKLFNLSYTVIK